VISFIIPAHNEAALIGPTVRAIRTAAAAIDEPCEIIVVDDASTDATAATASEAGARVVAVKRRQIAAVRNAGAAAARGQWLMFVDADTLLPADTAVAAAKALRHGAVGGGARVRFEGHAGFGTHAGAATWNLVSRLMRWAAGSFLFADRAAFEAVGGFDERYFAAEEIVLSDRLKQRGPFVILSRYVETSARKERMYGLVGQFAALLRVVRTGGAALRRREGLELWYEGRREDAT
jgi:glycosyltransferase involved in cell wall biosynthesis